MKYDKISRRWMLQGLGGAALTLPFLPSLIPRQARGQSIVPPKRFVAIKSYSAQNIIDWYPSTPVPGYQVRPADDAGQKRDGTTILTQRLAESSGRHSNGDEYFGTWAPLRDFSSTGISRILGSEFNPYLEKMLLLRGLDFMPDTNHNEGGILGNYAHGLAAQPGAQDNPTLDHILAHSPQFYSGVPSGTRILHLMGGLASRGAVGGSGAPSNTFSYAPRDLSDVPNSSVDQVQAHVDPRTAFDEAFQNFMGTNDPPAADDQRSRLVDRVIEDYRRVRDGSRIGAEDRQRLEQHVAFLSELQARLDGLGGGPVAGCGSPMRPSSIDTGGEQTVDVGTLRQTYELLIDVLVAAFACDVTRIATVDVVKAIGRASGLEEGFFHGCDPCGTTGATNWHTHAHNWDQAGPREITVTINEWIAREVMLPVVARLDALTDVDGSTMLDNSIVLWGNELGMNHLNYSIPTVLAGSAGGYLQAGRYIDYIDWNRPVRFAQHNGMVIEGVPYNRLLISILQAMGLGPEDYEASPGAGFGESRNLGKSSAFATDYDHNRIADPLPDLRA
ncbi:MAG: DUF1552 domain-containing protein [Myxococcales bacterium]|nr:DUF1552 domain-containing protein [Myxococcales bacterium]MDH3484855.1 DUF1552 domain-containing protein [Myxococcales bacterium]